MPYSIRKSGSGFKVCKKDGSKCFSKKPLARNKAKAQMRAIYANESFSLQRLIEECMDQQNEDVGFVQPKTPTPFEVGLKDGLTTKHPERKASMEQKLKLPETHWMHQYAKGWLQGFATPRLNTKA